MAYKIYQKLKSGMGALGLLDSSDVDDAVLHMKQETLNGVFNQGKCIDGNGNVVQMYKGAANGCVSVQNNGEIDLTAETKSAMRNKQVTLSFGANEDTITLMLLHENMVITKVKTINVQSVKLSYCNTLQQTVDLTAASQNISMGSADYVIVEITRTVESQEAIVGLLFNL